MPLVRISLLDNRGPEFGKRIGEVIFRAMRETLNVPPKDNFQVISTHAADRLIYDPSYLDIARTDGVVFIQVTLNEGRTVEMKRNFYKTLADALHEELGIRREDVFINLVEVTKENWSFGNGIGQYA
jgi:phenylpyruvate tautomerase PptA (4-oxalocrotonate tautomerase family)